MRDAATIVATKRGGYDILLSPTDGGFFMSKVIDCGTPEAAQVGLDRRTLLSLAPAAAIASSVSKIGPPGSEDGPLHSANINDALAALWDQTAFVSSSVVSVNSAAAIDALVSGQTVGLISLSRPEVVGGEDRGDLARNFPRFAMIRLEAHLSRQGLNPQNWLERWNLLLGHDESANGSLKGFVRAHGALCGQRIAFYKPHDDRNAYLIGTRDGVVHRRRQMVCLGEFAAAHLPNYIRLLRDGEDQVKVESIKYLIPPRLCSPKWREVAEYEISYPL